MGSKVDSQNQGKTVVDTNLVPFGEKFDNTTVMLTYKRLWHKRVSLNMTLFDTYEALALSCRAVLRTQHRFPLHLPWKHACFLLKHFHLLRLRGLQKFNSSGILGGGGFGCIYRGIMEDGTEVTVKLLRQDNQNGDYEFAAEVGMLSRLH